MDFSEYAPELQPILSGFSDEVSRLIEDLAKGLITIDEWYESMRSLLALYHASAYSVGNGGKALTELAKDRLADKIVEQSEYLKNFSNIIKDTLSGNIPPEEIPWAHWGARAQLYVPSINSDYWEAQTEELPLPDMPGAGNTQCRCIISPEMPVLTRRGWIPMLDVKVGDEVFTHKRRWRKVISLVVKPSEPYHTAYSLNGVVATNNHLWFTELGWVNSSYIYNSGIPVYNIERESITDENLSKMWYEIRESGQNFPMRVMQNNVSLREFEGSSFVRMPKLCIESASKIAMENHEFERKNSGVGSRTTVHVRRFGSRKVANEDRWSGVWTVLGRRLESSFHLPLSMELDTSARAYSIGDGNTSQRHESLQRLFRKFRINDKGESQKTSRGDCKTKSTRINPLVDLRKLWKTVSETSFSGNRIYRFAEILFRRVFQTSSSTSRMDLRFLRERIQTLFVGSKRKNTEILFKGMLPHGTAVFDLEVEEDHSFCINGIFAHNTNCKCRWEIDWIDRSKGDADCYWKMSDSEHCQTCLERAQRWNPLRVRGWELELPDVKEKRDQAIFNEVSRAFKHLAGQHNQNTHGRWARGLRKPNQTVLVNDPDFKRWFGKSKVVNPDGSPRVVYHGTVADFTTFEASKDPHAPLDQILGAHFADDPNVAGRFGIGIYRNDVREEEKITGGNVKPVYIKMENPRVIKPIKGRFDQYLIRRDAGDVVFEERKDLFIDWMKSTDRGYTDEQINTVYEKLKKRESITKSDTNGIDELDKNSEFAKEDGNYGFGMWFTNLGGYRWKKQPEFAEAYKQILKRKGYDGIVYKNTAPMETGEIKVDVPEVSSWWKDPQRIKIPRAKTAKSYIVFEPNQVKSALFNSGEFDPKNQDITKELHSFALKHLQGKHDQKLHGSWSKRLRSPGDILDSSDDSVEFSADDYEKWLDHYRKHGYDPKRLITERKYIRGQRKKIIDDYNTYIQIEKEFAETGLEKIWQQGQEEAEVERQDIRDLFEKIKYHESAIDMEEKNNPGSTYLPAMRESLKHEQEIFAKMVKESEANSLLRIETGDKVMNYKNRLQIAKNNLNESVENYENSHIDILVESGMVESAGVREKIKRLTERWDSETKKLAEEGNRLGRIADSYDPRIKALSDKLLTDPQYINGSDELVDSVWDEIHKLQNERSAILQKVQQLSEDGRRTRDKYKEKATELLYRDTPGRLKLNSMPGIDTDVLSLWQNGFDIANRLSGVNPLVPDPKTETSLFHRSSCAYPNTQDFVKSQTDVGGLNLFYLRSISGSVGADKGTVIHEIGHHIEHHDPLISKACREFLDKRTRNELTEQLSVIAPGRGYENDEVTKKDKFRDPYMGKIYKSGSTEILSMGMQLFYEDPIRFAQKDPMTFDFVYAVLRMGGKL